MSTAERRTDDRAGYPPPALTAAVLALIAVVLAAWAVAATAETLARATGSYTPVEATVVDERTEMRLVADRRGSSPQPFRVVTVELPDGVRADVRSDDLALGTTATVYRSDSVAVFETPPARPGPLEWTLCSAMLAASVVLALLSVRCALSLRSSS
jgi:lysozyme family protein